MIFYLTCDEAWCPYIINISWHRQMILPSKYPDIDHNLIKIAGSCIMPKPGAVLYDGTERFWNESLPWMRLKFYMHINSLNMINYGTVSPLRCCGILHNQWKWWVWFHLQSYAWVIKKSTVQNLLWILTNFIIGNGKFVRCM